ncbi:MAG: sulfotransferase family 2 domain-containing protein [Opitutales bacterium]|nr:sulfotransferase family 2 domain-containing protein [Opitutales bacterium]
MSKAHAETIPAGSFLIFLHIQKTAGITVQRMLRRHYGPGVFKRLGARLGGSQAQGGTMRDALAATTPANRYFAGHMCYGVHRYLPQPSTYLAFFREPVSRLVSLYHYSKTNETAYYHSYAKNASAEEFLLETDLMELDNGQVRFVAGDEADMFINRTPVGGCGEDLLEQAKRNIENDFGFVGIMERFDESAVLLGKRLGWHSSFYLRRNTGRKGTTSAVSDEVKRRVREKNRLDVAFYSFLCERFDQDAAAYGSGFAEDVADFRRKNLLYSRVLLPPYELYDAFKARLSGNPNRPR